MKGKDRYLYLDAEYHNSKERVMEVVCFSHKLSIHNNVQDVWVYKDEKAKKRLKDYYLTKVKEGYFFVSWNAQAEGRALWSIGFSFEELDRVKWIDLHAEYKTLLNQNHELMYGKQLIKGKKVTTYPPVLYGEKDGKNHSKPEKNLASACYKLLGVMIDTNRKNSVRDIIISGDEEVIRSCKKEILEYCASDVVYLPRLLNEEITHFRKLLGDEYVSREWLAHALYRGKYTGYASARMETIGYPVDVDKCLKLEEVSGVILFDLQREINSLFPDIKPFYFNRKDNRNSLDTKAVKEWIKTLDPYVVKGWERTDKGDLSLSLDAFEKFFPFRNEFPEDNFGAQFVRYLKTKRSFNGFMPTSDPRKKFSSSLGSDGFCRAFLNPYGSQTGRTQPKATGFIPLKSRWMRALIVPPKGYAMASIDYKSEEFLISGLRNRDSAMIRSYLSGDVYLGFGKESGQVPKDATKETHGAERQLLKGTVLGLSYNMSKYGLSHKLTMETGKKVDVDDAQEYIDQFEETYEDFTEGQKDYLEDYEINGYAMLDDGFVMFGDCDNERSIKNHNIQGTGSVILRRAVLDAYKRNVDVSFTLHDACYIIYPIGEYDKIVQLAKAMTKAFVDTFPDQPEAGKVGLDIETWSPEYEEKVVEYKGYEVHQSKYYFADPTAKKDYLKYLPYIEEKTIDFL